jgi:hypothetical protein
MALLGLLLAAAGAFRIAHALLSGGRITEALRTALTASAALESRVPAGPSWSRCGEPSTSWPP